GRAGGMEERVCSAHGIPFRPLPVEGWPRRKSPRRLWVALKLGMSLARSWMYLKKFAPQLVIGVGGYVSLPLVYVAQRMKIPTVIHEQNRLMGMANRMLAPRATRIYLSYEDTVGAYPKDRAQVVGNPVRAGFAAPPSRAEALEQLGLDPALPVVLAFGGSQGAQSLNRAMGGMVTAWSGAPIQVLWMTGNDYAAAARELAQNAPVATQVFAYIDDMVRACVAADVIVSRSGASSTAEIALIGKPSILVPYPHATDNHQEENARTLEDAGGAVVLLDSECTAERLGDELRNLLTNRERMNRMGQAARRCAKPGAAEIMVADMLSLVFESGESTPL
ncbi:MAG: undecaprenyldiphospho-muramoylpentapeptide beta-N-acetylglucosaminyltransferase, partial [Candidatus Hydrogenedentes bacterium]|nr:undecaprenyldiphospho-muramoylpentapeptide beta-N-acetylglucosaminyltransferase [Candidatus Hydrogenedentota bacterium]